MEGQSGTVKVSEFTLFDIAGVVGVSSGHLDFATDKMIGDLPAGALSDPDPEKSGMVGGGIPPGGVEPEGVLGLGLRKSGEVEGSGEAESDNKACSQEC